MIDRHSDDDLRVGNPERERAIALLNDSFSSGYLEIAEFEDRSGLVYAAKTRRELRKVLENLPSATMLFPAPAAAAAAGPAPEPLNLTADWGEVRRKGVWEVPPSIFATASVGTVDLDFTAARFTGPSTTVQLQVSASTVKVRVGPEHDVRFSDLHLSGWSGVKDKAGAPTRPGGAVIELIGSASAMSSVTIRRRT